MDEFLKLLEIVLQVFEVNGNPQGFLILLMLLFARFFAFVKVVPFLGRDLIPVKIQFAIATALVLITFPSITGEISFDQSFAGLGPVEFIALIGKEIFVGFTLGFVASIFFESVLVAGRIIDIQRGANMGGLFAPGVVKQISPIAQFKLFLAIVVFFTSGIHRFFISSLIKSFEVIPVTKFPEIETGWIPVMEFITVLSAQVFAIGLQLSIPVIIALILTDLLMGLINRLFPQANMFFISLSIKMLIGILVVLISLQVIIARFVVLSDDFYGTFKLVIDYLAKFYS